jgi:hypothetical protein
LGKEEIMHCSLCPLLSKNIVFKFPIKKIQKSLQLTLDFIFIVFKSFIFSVGFIKFSSEHVFSKTNPGTVDEEELVASLIDKGVICATALLYIFILRARGW